MINGHSPRYGLVIIAMSFLAQFVGSGFIYYGFSAIVVPLSQELTGGNRSSVMSLQLILGLMGVVCAPTIGRLAANGHSRAILALGMAATGTGMILVAQMHSLFGLALVFMTALAFGSIALLGAATTTIIVNWMEKNRGMAFGIANAGASAAGIVLAPITAMLIGSYGWRGAFTVLGTVALAMTIVIWKLAIEYPPRPANADAADKADPAPVMPIWQAFRNSNVWLIGLTGGMAIMASTAFLAHVIAFGMDKGLSPIDAAYIASSFAAGGVAGKLFFGRLSDWIGPRASFNIALASSAAAFFTLSLISGHAAIGAVSFWLAMGSSGALPLINATVASVFGARAFGSMIGAIWPVVQLPALSGPMLVALIYDVTGSYSGSFLAIAAALFCAIIMNNAIRYPKSEEPIKKTTIEDVTNAA